MTVAQGRVLYSAGAVLALAAVIVLATPALAWGLDCTEITDCLGNSARGSLSALVGVGMLALLLFAPEIGVPLFVARGLVEGVTGKDVVSGEPLDWKMRALGLLPVAGEVAGELKSVVQLERTAVEASELGGAGADLMGLERAATEAAPVADIPKSLAEEAAAGGTSRVTGGRSLDAWDEILGRVEDPSSLKAFEFRDQYADDFYEIVRNADSADDIRLISSSSDMRPDEIARIRSHLFEEEHDLGTRIGRFDADPDISDAWRRLQSGVPEPADLDLLRHELAEANWMRDHPGVTYEEAHNAANQAGHTWHPPEWDQR